MDGVVMAQLIFILLLWPSVVFRRFGGARRILFVVFLAVMASALDVLACCFFFVAFLTTRLSNGFSTMDRVVPPVAWEMFWWAQRPSGIPPLPHIICISARLIGI